MIAEVRRSLADLKKDFPKYDGRGYEVAGFVWYQGWNDGVDPKNAVPEYEQNLVNLIKDVRKDLKAPNLPFVIGELTGPWVKAPGAWATLRKAQAAAAARPEFKGNVLFVETHDFVRKPEDSPNPGHGHHEFGNAETYFLVGDALGKGMKRLLTLPPPKKADEPAKPISHTVRKIEGWTVRIDDRLLHPECGLADGERLLGRAGQVRPPPPGRGPADAAEHRRAALGHPARAGAHLSRSGAGLRRAADPGGVREVQEERSR
jgi:hypothetical protein